MGIGIASKDLLCGITKEIFLKSFDLLQKRYHGDHEEESIAQVYF